MLSDSLVQKLKNELSLDQLQVILKPEWSSENLNFRKKIRESIIETLGVSDINILDLDRVPSLDKIGLSISHCKALGGFVSSTTTRNLGFDIELSNRLSEKHLKRISVDETEFNEAPSAAHLWVAKEAAYKSMYQLQQPIHMLDIKLADGKSLRISIAAKLKRSLVKKI